MSDDRIMFVAAVIVAASQDRPARGPADGLQSGQVIGGAALGNPRVAAPFLILARTTQHPTGCRAQQVHLPAGKTLNRVIRVLALLREVFGQPSLNRTAGVRASEEERSHCER